jgi:hypothetical protein
MKTIYIGNAQAQEQSIRAIYQQMMRAIQFRKLQMGDTSPVTESPFDLNRSIKLMKNRINKHFGLNNKYAKHVMAKL